MPNTVLSRPISFDVSSTDMRRIRKIARRGSRLLKEKGVERDRVDVEMDLCACHANGCQLDFEKLERFDDFNLLHDLLGIARCLDHNTGRLRRHFLPRCSLPSRLQKPAVAICIRCGCTDDDACEGGCGWVVVDRLRAIGVCSSCTDSGEAARSMLKEWDA